MQKLFVRALSFSFMLSLAVNSQPSLAVQSNAPSTIEELRTEKIKVLSKRDPKAEELIRNAQAKIDKLKLSAAGAALASRLQSALDQIAFGSGGMSELRIKADIELLDAIVKEHKEPTAEELAPLQERYKKICGQFDDMIFSKDLDRAFHIHDKLIRFTSLALWDKDKISSELERIEGLIERAPDIPYGKAQLFDTCKNKRLASVAKLVYLGSSSHEEMYLTGDRRSVAVIDEGCGQPLNMELAEHIVQNPDGSLFNLNDCDSPSLGLPFSPPLSLWAKSRILDGRVPAVLFKLVDSGVKANNPAYTSAAGKSDFISVADINSGKLDDYFKNNLRLLGPQKSPALVGLFSEFDREAAATAFGADGKTPYYTILDPKLKDLSGSKLEDELHKRFQKGTFAGTKGTSAELCNQYGDAAIPDGPERIRDAWKRLHKLSAEAGASSIALFSSAGSFHGNKNAGKFEGEDSAGNQAWNKLEYYWPGEGVLDWLGINGVGNEPVENPKGPNLMEALESFMTELRNSNWQATPVMLVNLAPARSKSPLAESAWINTTFTKIIPGTFPNILAVYINVLDDLTLWTPEGKSSFRSYVSSNKFYNFKLRFKSLETPADSSKPSGGS